MNRMNRMKWSFLIVASALTPLWAAPASGQPGQENALAEAGGDGAVGEIVVTANRRSESINKVPASIAAYDQEALDERGIRSFADMVVQTPGLSLQQQSTFQPANIAIRGIRSTVGGSTTGIYIDDTPIQARNAGPQNAGDALPAIFDLERVEVLRGPQGTLFGSGSQGGSVRFISPAPSLSETGGYGRAEVATTDNGGLSYEAGLAASIPLVADKLAVRLSASYRHDAGYIDRIDERTGVLIDDDANESDVITMKAALAWSPIDGLRITPSFNFQETRRRDAAQFYVRLSDRSERRLVSGRTLRQPSDDRFYLPAVKIEADFGSVTATSVTSYFVRRQSILLDFTNLDEGVVRNFNGMRPPASQLPGIGTLPLPTLLPEAFVAAGGASNNTVNRQDSFTQELRLQSNDSAAAFRWLIGGFYQKAKQINEVRVNDAFYADAFELLLGFPNYQGITRYYRNFRGTDEQLAGFANVDYRLGEFNLSAGARIALMKFGFTEELRGSFARGYTFNQGEQEETPVTPKVTLAWEPDSATVLYASASKGYRSGGANPPITPTAPCLASLDQLGLAAAPLTYDSDTVWNYELGAKIGAFDRRVQINASIYHIDWSNIQSSVSLNGCPLGFVTNLGSANSDGFDLSISAQPVESLYLALSAGYNNSRFAQTIAPNNVILAEKGAQISDLPPWQVAATVEYSQPMSGGDVYLRGVHQYASRNGGTISRLDTPTASGYDRNGRRNEGYHLTSLRIGWRSENFDVSLFADNLFNSHPELNHISNAFPTDTTYYANTLRPRTIGLTLTARR